jgi:HEAT repeat protein
MILLVAFLLSAQSQPTPSTSMKADVDRLVGAAESLTGVWPTQPPPPIPEVAVVARHGKPVTPLLLTLLSDDPNVEHDRKRWKVHQQVALALCRIYSESEHCGRTYCDGDPPGRISHVKSGWLKKIAADAEIEALSPGELLDRFTQEKLFTLQFEIGRALAARGDRHAISELEGWLTHDDRHLRGNVAFVLARLSDPRGFHTIAQILADKSPRSQGQGTPFPRWTLDAQIRSDRYYAAHLLGDLKDPRGIELLVPLLNDTDLDDKAAWSLAEIGDRRAIGPLLEALERDDPSTRVVVISMLAKLSAREALPKLRELLQDNRRSRLGNPTSVAEAARRAIAVIAQQP